jgi:hypothetical protein
VDLRAFLRPRLTLKFYSTIPLFLEMQPYVGVKANHPSISQCSFGISYQLYYGVDMEFGLAEVKLGWKWFSYTLINQYSLQLPIVAQRPIGCSACEGCLFGGALPPPVQAVPDGIHIGTYYDYSAYTVSPGSALDLGVSEATAKFGLEGFSNMWYYVLVRATVAAGDPEMVLLDSTYSQLEATIWPTVPLTRVFGTHSTGNTDYMILGLFKESIATCSTGNLFGCGPIVGSIVRVYPGSSP